jgi:catechol 2,3-dioxygenase-like lactoylglutathione lyase family enzyme
MIQAKRLGHVTLRCPDLERTLAHYAKIVGLVEAARTANSVFLATRIGQLALELKRSPDAGCEKLSFEISPSLSVDEVVKNLAAHGLKPEVQSDPAPTLSKVVAFTDPKGTTIELFADWTNVGKTENAAEVSATKMGHLAFMVADPKAMAEFYQSVLGFRVSDWIEDWFVFLRCGPDHHTVNFVQGKTTRMHHMAFELKDWAQVQSACDFLGGRDIPIIWGPGRHGPGHNVYTYHRNPDDQIIELFTELDKMLDESLGYFDPRPWHRDHPQRPKVWEGVRDIWGLPPSADYLRQRQ